jgi:thioredoxin 1
LKSASATPGRHPEPEPGIRAIAAHAADVRQKIANFIVNRAHMETSEKRSFGEIIQGSKPVLVDFSAEWCGPCKMMPPILKEVKDKMGESVMILKLDIDKNPAVASAYGIQSVPTLIVFRDGQIKWRQSGVTRADQLKVVLDGILKQG